MPLQDITFNLGVFTDSTPREAGKAGYWAAADKVRFYDGKPTKLGGWTRGASDASILGLARGVCDWRTYRSEVLVAVGTHLKLYVWSGGAYYDVTPIESSGTLADPFATTSGSAIVAVTDNSHGLLDGDYATFSGATAVGGLTVDGSYTVSVIDSNSYNITCSSAATSTTTGGGSVGYAYELHVGAADSVVGLGWGAGLYSYETYSTPRSVSNFLAAARTWAIEQWGEDVVCNPRGGKIYFWDSSVGVGSRAAVIAQAPVAATSILVSTEDRHLIALGAHDGVVHNTMLVRWCDQENFTDWTPSLTNTAGDKQLDSGNEIVCGAKVRGEHLLFTDSSLYSMAYVGPPDTFAFRMLGDNGGLVGPNAVHTFEGVAYWMGDRDFFIYDGVTKVLQCTVSSEVFDDFNRTQRAKVWAGVNREYREVWWLFPSADSNECDKYVIFSITQQVWTYGTLDRTLLVGDSDVMPTAYGFSPDGYMYMHEVGTDDYLSPMNAYIESGGFEVDAGGNQLAHVSKFIPDVAEFSGSLGVEVSGKKYPQSTEVQTSGPHTITPTTQFINPRVRCRQMALRVSSSALGDSWRLGSIRLELTPHGGR